MLVLLRLVACVQGPLPGAPSDVAAVSEAETCRSPVAFYVDPRDGSDAADGRTPHTALRTLAALPDALEGGTAVALRRGTVARLDATLALHGSPRGWVCYTSWGDPTAPKPIVAASVPILAEDWSAPDAEGRRTFDWSPHRIADAEHAPRGPEQAPGNLWFFADDLEDAPLLAGGRKRDDADALVAPGDWAYDPDARVLTLRWDGAPPAATEAALPLEPAITFEGQEHVLLEDWDLRYAGGYALRGHEARDLRVRRVDLAWIGGATKRGELVRMGNGFETTGDVSDIVVEACRFHEIWDTALDPQDTAGSARQERLTYRDNVVSRTGLAGVELWLKPGAARLRALDVTGNVFVGIGHGWGYDQHDTAANPRVGAAVLVGDNEAEVSGLDVTGNVVADSRAALMADWAHLGARALLDELRTEENTWAGVGVPAVVLFEGSFLSDGGADLGASPRYDTLADWQASRRVPGQEVGSVVDQDVPRPELRAATRFGPFPLAD